jgi:hypothetical protein
VVGGALVVPGGLVRRMAGVVVLSPEEFSISRQEVEARAVAAVLATEEVLGWTPQDMNEVQRNHAGYDVRSVRRRTGDKPADVRFIEVKGRIAGAPTVTVSRNEVLTSLNEPERFVLALVEVSPDRGETVRYLRRPFEGRSEEMLFDVTSINFDWKALWDRADQPI